jgi:hypothetical protein
VLSSLCFLSLSALYDRHISDYSLLSALCSLLSARISFLCNLLPSSSTVPPSSLSHRPTSHALLDHYTYPGSSSPSPLPLPRLI